MVKWTIKRGQAIYAELIQDEESFRIEKLSAWAKNDDFPKDLQNKFQRVYHPLEGIQRIKATGDKYKIDLWLGAWIQQKHKEGKESMDIEVEGIEWKELLGEPVKGVLY